MTITFIIPVRHPDNAKDWQQTKNNLSDTARSIAAQDHADWKAVVVANNGADLPPLPEKFSVAYVDFLPNPLYEQGDADQKDFYDAVRLDKGRRILAGMLSAPSDYYMIVDDDDFVSRKIAGFVAGNKGANGWFVQDGYAWEDGGDWLFRHPDLSHICGSTLIIRSDLYQLPSSFDAANDTMVKEILGSHKLVTRRLKEGGTPLSPLPFYGAVYRIGHAGAHSKSKGLLGYFIFKKSLLKNLPELVRSLFRLRRRTPSINQEFFGT